MRPHRIGARRLSVSSRCAGRARSLLLASFAAAVCLGALATGARGETWAERLGYPTGKKVLLLHATELGMCYETNAATRRLLDAGLVNSAAAMAPCPWFSNVLPWAAAQSRNNVGLSLTLNSPGHNYRWKPVASQNLVPSLTDSDGYFWETPMQTMVNASAAEVELELEAQIALAKSMGLRPSHFTTHLGTLVTRPDLMEVYLRIARRHWTPAVVVELTPELVERFAQDGLPMPDDVIQMMSDYPLPKVDDLRFVPAADSYEAKKRAFLEMLQNLSPGITQIAFAPADESEALKQISPNWQQRVWEARLLEDPDVQKVLKSNQFVLTDWSEMMDRFEGTQTPLKDQE